MSVELPTTLPKAPRLFSGQNYNYAPGSSSQYPYSSSASASASGSVANSTVSSAAPSRSQSPMRSLSAAHAHHPLPPPSSHYSYQPPHTRYQPRYRSSSATSNSSDRSGGGAPSAPPALSRGGSSYSSRRSSMCRFPVVVDGSEGGVATPPSRRMSRSPGYSQPVNLVTAWSALHNHIIPHLTARDLMNLRLVSKTFIPTVSPRLFEHLHITFSKAVLRPARIFTLKHVGHHVKTVTFRIPHSADMILPPLIHDKTGVPHEFRYEPEVANPALGFPPPNPNSQAARYGSIEMAELLVQKYPPIFHVATNVSAFMDLFSAFPELVHLIIACPGQRAAERLKMSVVDYALISVRIAVEQARLSKLTRLSINRIHAAGLRHLHPLHGAGSTAGAVSRWSQLRTLDMIVDVLPLYHSPPLVRGIQADVESVLMVRDFIAYFAPVVERLGFAWAGGRGPNVLTLGKSGISVADSGNIAAPLVPAMTIEVGSERAGTKTSIFGRKRFPVISRPTPAVQTAVVTPAPLATVTAGADVLPLPQLVELRIGRVVDSDRNLAALLKVHSKNLVGFSLEDVGLTSGLWTEVLAPLTDISGSTEWRTQVEAALAGMEAVCGARVKIVGGGTGSPKHVLVTLLAEAMPKPPHSPRSSSAPPAESASYYPGYQQVLAARARAPAPSVSSSAASAISGFSSSTSVSSRRSSVVTSSATSCYSVCPPVSSAPSFHHNLPPASSNTTTGSKLRPASYVGAPAVRPSRPARSTTISTPSPSVYAPYNNAPMLTITEAKTPTSPGLAPGLLRAESMPSIDGNKYGPLGSRIPLVGAAWSCRSRSGSTTSVVSSGSGAITINVRSKRGSLVEAARPVIAELASTLPPVEGCHPIHRLCDADFKDKLIEKPTARQIEAAVHAAGEWRQSMVAEYDYVPEVVSNNGAGEGEGESQYDPEDDATPVPTKPRTLELRSDPTSPSPIRRTTKGEPKMEYPVVTRVDVPAEKQAFVKRSLRHISSLVRLRKEREAASFAVPVTEPVPPVPKDLRLRQLALVSHNSPQPSDPSYRTTSQPTSRPSSPQFFNTRPLRYSMAGPAPSRRPSIRSEVPSIQEEDESSVSPVADYRLEDDAEVARYLQEVADRSDSDSDSQLASSHSDSESDRDSDGRAELSRVPLPPPSSPAVMKPMSLPRATTPPPPIPLRSAFRSTTGSFASIAAPSASNSVATSARGSVAGGSRCASGLSLHVITESTSSQSSSKSSAAEQARNFVRMPSPRPESDWMQNFATSPGSSPTGQEVASSSGNEFDADDTDLTVTEATINSGSVIYRGPPLVSSPVRGGFSRVLSAEFRPSGVNVAPAAIDKAISDVSTPKHLPPIPPTPPTPTEPVLSSESHVSARGLNGTRTVLGKLSHADLAQSAGKPSRVHRALTRAKSAFGLNVGSSESRTRPSNRLD